MSPDLKLQLTDLLDKVIRIVSDPDRPQVQKDREVLLLLDKMKRDIWGMK